MYPLKSFLHQWKAFNRELLLLLLYRVSIGAFSGGLLGSQGPLSKVKISELNLETQSNGLKDLKKIVKIPIDLYTNYYIYIIHADNHIIYEWMCRYLYMNYLFWLTVNVFKFAPVSIRIMSDWQLSSVETCQSQSVKDYLLDRLLWVHEAWRVMRSRMRSRQAFSLRPTDNSRLRMHPVIHSATFFVLFLF